MGRRRKLRLPPTTEKGISTYFRRRGYRENPLLQDKKKASISFDKPLPSGGRQHVRVYKTPRRFIIKVHEDKYDPYRNPIGHIITDTHTRRRGRTYRIKRRKTTKKSWWPF